jgi:uncharacterized protein (TIRG00374 family)
VLLALAFMINPDWVADLPAGGKPDPDLRFAARWLFALPVILCAALHYACAAVALQASSGAQLPIRRRILAQLSAAAANRLTPAGVGGAAVNARFLVRAGGLSGGEAAGAVLSLAALGAVADLFVFAGLAAGCALAGIALPPAQMAALHGRLVSFVHVLGYVGLTAMLVAMMGAGVLLVRSRRSRRSKTRAGARSTARWRETAAQAVKVARKPRAVAVLMMSSAGTTLLMGLALLSAVEAVSGSSLTTPPALVVLAYMVGAAAGSAASLPSVVGLTEAGLVGGLTLLGVPFGQAAAAVVLFRVLTFWLPAVAGLPAARTLRHQGWL